MIASGKPIHVLFIPAWYFDHASEGIFIREHARMMLSQNCRVGLMYLRKTALFSRRRLQMQNELGIDTVISTGYFLPKVGIGLWMWKRAYYRLWKKYLQQHGQPDLIHAHGYLAGIAAQSIAIREKIPYIITEHSTAIPAGQVPLRHIAGITEAYRDAVALIAVSDFLRKSMQQFTLQKILVIGNPVDVERFQVRQHSLHSPVRLITIGSLESRKNYALLLDALTLLRNKIKVHLTIIGTGPLLSQLQDQAARLDMQNHINFAGSVTDDEIRTYLANSDIFVASSVMENFGVAIAEAMASGLPVVTTNSGGPEEFISDHTGRICERNAESLANAMEEIIEHYSHFRAAEIRAVVYSRFSFPVVGSIIRKVYDVVTGVLQ